MRLPWLVGIVCRPFLTIFEFTFPLWLTLLKDWACLTVGFAFLQPTLFPATISYHTTLSFLLRNCLSQSCWASLGLPFILLLMAQYGHWFFDYITSGLLCPICFLSGVPGPFDFLRLPWPLTLHSQRLLLSSLGFPSPITLSLILRAHRLAINPLLSLLSLHPFLLFHIIYSPWFAFFFSLLVLL